MIGGEVSAGGGIVGDVRRCRKAEKGRGRPERGARLQQEAGARTCRFISENDDKLISSGMGRYGSLTDLFIILSLQLCISCVPLVCIGKGELSRVSKRFALPFV